MSNNRSHFGWSKPILAFLIPILIVLSASRLALLVWQFDRVAEVGGVGYVMLQGLRFDLVTLGLLLAIPAMLLPFIVSNELTRKAGLQVVKIYFLFLTGCLVFMELSTPNFIGQFDFRPNILFVEYLNHPKEIITMLLKAVPLQITAAVVITLLAIYGMNKLLGTVFDRVNSGFILTAPLLSFLALLLCVIAARSTLDHRPVNPSTVAFSSDPLVNSLPLNSTYTILYALYEKFRYENGEDNPYGELPAETVIATVRAATGLPENAFFDPEIPTLHYQEPTSQNSENSFSHSNNSPKNLVIILEESLGADYVGKLGGLPITPNIDALSQEGVWFNQMYATGTRSVRGIEAVVTGFLPTPMRSVVKLGGSQFGFFTLGELLARKNYATSFIYGGEAHFDNMRRFFTNNGFAQIVDENDYENPVFYGSWGASDEDLFTKAHETFNAHQKDGKPFFSLVFTSSNHSPFDFPDGRIELYDQPKATVANAVKYTDYALGDFIAKAKQSDYWENTIFLIIADHSDRVFGADLVPIERFRIPALILNSGQPPREVDRIVSQIDMLPTLLSMMGVASAHPAIGIDLTRPDLDQIPGRAIMQYDGTQAYMEGDDVIILQKEKTPEQYIYRDGQLLHVNIQNSELKQRALAHALWPMQAYRDKSYRLPDPEQSVALKSNIPAYATTETAK